MISVDREQALRLRLDGHNLARRQPPGNMLKVAGACGVQNTPPGSAAIGLHARVEGLTPTGIEHTLAEEKTLVQVWSLRASPHLGPGRRRAGRCGDQQAAGLVRESDLPRLESPPVPQGVRLLPPHDPYLQMRDRETLLRDSKQRRLVWRSVGSPGAVLAGGRIRRGKGCDSKYTLWGRYQK